MDVRLLFHTPEPERAVAVAARLCYAPVGAAELMEEMSDEAIRRVLKTILDSGHLSTLEHASYTFAIDGVSRAMTHQLVRHRLASYNQQSQRYVSYAEEPQFIVPPEVEADPRARVAFLDACASAFSSYRAALDNGIAAEDARYLLPNAMETKIVVTMNVRELLHFFELRCCKRAQWEIRAVALRMLELAEPTAPYIFMDAGASCRRGPCREGKMTCGDPYPRAPKRDLTVAEDSGVTTIQHTHIGGQAVLEGIMMRGKHNWAIAVRLPDGGIHVEEHDLKTSATKRPWLGKPIIRGVVGLYETMALAFKAFEISASFAGETEEEQLSSKEIGFSMIIGVALAVGLFIVLPAVVTNFAVGSAADRPFAWNALDGVLRLLAFFTYIWAVGRIPDIARVFAYHGAEHKTIHAYEHGLPLETEHIQKWDTMHVRCGTSFLLMVMVIALIVYSLVPIKTIVAAWGLGNGIATLLVAISLRIILLPLIAGLAYEVIKWAGKSPDKPLVKILLWPGLMLQKMTTREPDDSMVEIAVAAVQPVIERENAEDAVLAGTTEPSAVAAATPSV